ncbi:MAG TPA: hypothetical protein VMX38_20530, partial [Verrucomicrobiae bacterium]|nr:hypothetical protein [Verrucomicrobiae bacterium]
RTKIHRDRRSWNSKRWVFTDGCCHIVPQPGTVLGRTISYIRPRNSLSSGCQRIVVSADRIAIALIDV